MTGNRGGTHPMSRADVLPDWVASRAASTPDVVALVAAARSWTFRAFDAEVTRTVRGTDGPNRDTPIVALSASAFAEDRERAITSGMNDFATKPIELESLRGVLNRWTGQRVDRPPTPATLVN